MRILQPEGWTRPKGYSHGIAAEGTMVFVAGQIGCVADGTIQTDDFVAQTRQALENTVAVLAEANATPAHITRMTWYVTDKRDYLDNLAEPSGAISRQRHWFRCRHWSRTVPRSKSKPRPLSPNDSRSHRRSEISPISMSRADGP
jgi:enamine deaminase RidA (YjgF/YER057c/UK114 family)